MFNKIITFCIFSTLFLNAFVLFKQPVEFYLSYVIIIALLPFFILKFKFPAFVLKIFIPILLFGLISVWTNDNTYPLFFKIFINVFFSVLFYYYVFVAYDLDVNQLFDYYMKGAVIICLIGLVQFVSFQIDFKYGYDFGYLGLSKWGFNRGGIFGVRLNSILSEPSTLGGTIGPAFLVALYNIMTRQTKFISRKSSLLIIIIYLLTFSSVAYAGVFVSLILILINMGFLRNVLIFAPIILASYFYLYNNVEDFRGRVDGITDLYQGKAKRGFDVNGSSFVQYNNFHVAVQNLIHNPLYGTGLGSHPIAYDKYSLGKQFKVVDEFNKSDANSMFYRMMSETGLLGILFILLFIIKLFVQKKPGVSDDDDLWLISSAALVAIFLQLLRQGNYTYNGFMFFMWLYYYTKLASKNAMENKEAIESKNEDIISVH